MERKPKDTPNSQEQVSCYWWPVLQSVYSLFTKLDSERHIDKRKVYNKCSTNYLLEIEFRFVGNRELRLVSFSLGKEEF